MGGRQRSQTPCAQQAQQARRVFEAGDVFIGSQIAEALHLARSADCIIILTRLIAAGQLERVGRGLYSLPGSHGSEHESLVAVATKVPQAVFCLLTALQFHELTTQLPRQVWIAMPRGSHAPRIDYPPIKMVQFTGDAYTAGVEDVECDGVSLRIYSVAKTVADCFKHRSKAPAEDIWRFAKICRVAKVMHPYLESIG
jgi:predicted transcriptional regulator of viral defense system